MQFIVIGRDGKDPSKRQAQRPAHLEGAKKLKEDGNLLFATALIENGQMKGSVMIMEFSSREAFEAWRTTEPYVVGGVWENVEISECAVAPMFAKS